MNEYDTTGTVVTFEGSEEFEDGTVIGFSPSRPGKAEALKLGWDYFEADQPTQDRMLDQHGPVLMRRSLLVFGNYAARTGQREVAKYVAMLREEITVVHHNAKDEQAS
jgi:hypothetical protein